MQPEINHELTMFEAWIAENPSSQLFIRLAETYRDLNRIPEAIKVIERSLNYHPHNIVARIMLADMYKTQNQPQNARKYLGQAASIIAGQRKVFSELAALMPEHGQQLQQLAQDLKNVVNLLAGNQTMADTAMVPANIQKVLDKLESLQKAASSRRQASA